jgi:hypothetical protein
MVVVGSAIGGCGSKGSDDLGARASKKWQNKEPPHGINCGNFVISCLLLTIAISTAAG